MKNWVYIHNHPVGKKNFCHLVVREGLNFLDLAVAKSLQSTRTVTDDADDDDDDAADVLTTTGYTC